MYYIYIYIICVDSKKTPTYPWNIPDRPSTTCVCFVFGVPGTCGLGRVGLQVGRFRCLHQGYGGPAGEAMDVVGFVLLGDFFS